MATTEHHQIKTTEARAITYIANPEKTDGGRLIYTYGCSVVPNQASLDFEQYRTSIGTGRNTVLSQHLQQRFKPGEITPERALEIGKEFCDEILKGDYQYYCREKESRYRTRFLSYDEVAEIIPDPTTLPINEISARQEALMQARLDYLPIALRELEIHYPYEHRLIMDYFFSRRKVTVLLLAEKYGVTKSMIRYRLRLAERKLRDYILSHENESEVEE